MFTYQSLEFLYRVIDCPAIARVALLETVGKRVLSIADGKRHNLRGQSRGAKITLHSRDEYTTVKVFSETDLSTTEARLLLRPEVF